MNRVYSTRGRCRTRTASLKKRPNGNTTMKLLLFAALATDLVFADQPCCKTCDQSAGLAKYFSIDKLHNMCGECCMKPSDYPKYHLFEPGLKAANGTNTPCDDLSYPTYDSTVTHGFGPIKMTLDLYKPTKPSRGTLRGAAHAPSFIKDAANTDCGADDACAMRYRDCCEIQTCTCHLQNGSGKVDAKFCGGYAATQFSACCARNGDCKCDLIP